jgi:hypothetical protein
MILRQPSPDSVVNIAHFGRFDKDHPQHSAAAAGWFSGHQYEIPWQAHIKNPAG